MAVTGFGGEAPSKRRPKVTLRPADLSAQPPESSQSVGSLSLAGASVPARPVGIVRSPLEQGYESADGMIRRMPVLIDR